MNYFKSLFDLRIVFPKKVKFLTALRWWIVGIYFPYTKKRRWRKYCSKCGWPLIRVDDLYDPPETIHPNAIQVCSFCGLEYEVVAGEWFTRPGKYRYIFPIVT